MQTIGGGTVTYVDVQLLPCPDEPACVGQVLAPARLDVRWGDRVVESFALRVGDELLVSDGSEVGPGTMLTATQWSRTLRADIPDGVEALVQWSEPLSEFVDDVTGLRRFAFTADRPITLELLVDGAVIAAATMRQPTPIAEHGAIVRRGDRLAAIWNARRMRDLETGIETVRAFLDVRSLPGEPTALVAPCDALVVDVDERLIRLRTRDDRMLDLRRPPRGYSLVNPGDSVAAGDALTDGERNHHALLHAWGEHQLGEHIMDELSLFLGNKVPRVYWALALRAMLQDGMLRGISRRRGARTRTPRLPRAAPR